jgi:acetylornithine deacetylase
MDLFELTKKLVNIDSVTGNEKASGEFLEAHLRESGFEPQRQAVSEGRANLFAACGRPQIVLSTHMDTVPPFIPAQEDDEFIYGRGACDAKGILAAQITAAKRLRDSGVTDFGLLFLVGEETLSDGARIANARSPGSDFFINGEPTENLLAIGSKGILRVDIQARGRMAHSAYPELGESAIEKLLDVLNDLRRMALPEDAVLGRTTMNIGLIEGGRAGNVVPDEASAQILFRTVTDSDGLRRQVTEILKGRCEFEFVRSTPPLRLERLDGFETRVVAFTTDLPNLTRWGRPLLLGPGSIEEAHTDHERVRKQDLTRAVELYCSLVQKLKPRVSPIMNSEL